MSGGGVTPSPTPSVSDTFFWRYDNVRDATWLVNSQGQLVKAKQQVGIDDVFIGYVRNTGGGSIGFEQSTLVTEQWGEQRASFEGSTEGSWSITMNGDTLSYNGELTPAVTPWGYLPGLIARVVANENTIEPPSGEVSSAKLILYENVTENTILENETAELRFNYDSYDNVINIQWGGKQTASFLFEAIETQYPLSKGIYSLLDSEPDDVNGWGCLFFNN